MKSIVFFGSDDFAAYILESMINSGYNIVAVVTKPDRAIKRNKKLLSPIKQKLNDMGTTIPIYDPVKASTEEFAVILESYHPDLFVVVSYGEIISQRLLDIPKIIPLNIHPSSLPLYRGASPLRSAILNGDKKIGICIIEMVKAMDAGGVVASDTIDVNESTNHSEVEKEVFKRSAILLHDCIDNIDQRVLQIKDQDGEATYTKKFTKEDTLINWNNGVFEISNKIKAFGDKPGAYAIFELNGLEVKLKILNAEIVSKNSSDVVSTIQFSKEGGWHISCREGVLSVLSVQKEGKKAMDIKDFINGNPRSAPQPVLFK